MKLTVNNQSNYEPKCLVLNPDGVLRWKGAPLPRREDDCPCRVFAETEEPRRERNEPWNDLAEVGESSEKLEKAKEQMWDS